MATTADTPSAPAQSWQRGILAGAIAWIFPGAGHLFLGRWGRAAIYCVVVLTAAIVGWWLDGNVPHFEQAGPLAILKGLTALGLGLPYMVIRFGLDFVGDPTSAGFEYGSAFFLSAGLMNLLLVLDCWDIATGEKT